IALYALASGAVIAVGRLRFGLGPASAAKYVPESVFFYIGLAGLGLTLWDSRRTADNALDVRLVFVTGLAAGVFAAGWLASLNRELSRIDLIHPEPKDLALAIEWIPAIPSNPDLALAGVPSRVAVEMSMALSKYNALRPRFVPQSLASAVRENPSQGDPSVGILDSARFRVDHHLYLKGLAWLPYRHTRPDCIVVGYTNSDGLTPFTVFEPTCKRERLKGRFELERHLAPNGFAALVDSANLPTETLTL